MQSRAKRVNRTDHPDNLGFLAKLVLVSSSNPVAITTSPRHPSDADEHVSSRHGQHGTDGDNGPQPARLEYGGDKPQSREGEDEGRAECAVFHPINRRAIRDPNGRVSRQLLGKGFRIVTTVKRDGQTCFPQLTRRVSLGKVVSQR